MADLEGASDELLAQRAADGDTAAFAVIVRRHGPFLRAFAIRLAGSTADADDIVQEALITGWKQLPTLAEPAKVRAWLTTIVSRKSTDHFRSRKPSTELDDTRPDARPGPEGEAVTRSRLDALAAVLASLPDSQRECWVLKEVGGYSYEEIGQQLDLSPTVVRGKLARARATVIQEMEVWR